MVSLTPVLPGGAVSPSAPPESVTHVWSQPASSLPRLLPHPVLWSPSSSTLLCASRAHHGPCQGLALCQVPALCMPCWALTQASSRGSSDASRARGLFPMLANRHRVLNGLAQHQTASWCAGDGMGPWSAQYTRFLQVLYTPRFPRLPQVPPGSPGTPRLLQVPQNYPPPQGSSRLPQAPQAPALGTALGSAYPAPPPFSPH